jgi:hypothetical protein
MNLEPWQTGDLKGQEEEGYKDGQLHCKQGWARDESGNQTPYIKGYHRGWYEAYGAGLHGTEPIKRDKKLPYIDEEIIRSMFGN